MSRGQELLKMLSHSLTHIECELVDDDTFYQRMNNEHVDGSIQYELNCMQRLFNMVKRIFENYDDKDKWF